MCVCLCASYLEDEEVVSVTGTKHKLRPNICEWHKTLYRGDFELLETEREEKRREDKTELY